MTSVREHCDQCGFDSDLYGQADTITSQRIIGAVIEAAIEGLPDDLLNRRPDAATWSIAEYIDHVREMVFGNRFAIEAALADPGIDLGEPPPAGDAGDHQGIGVAVALAGVETEYAALYELLNTLDDDAWDTACTLGGELLTVNWFARHVLHDGLHHLGDIGRIRHGFGLGAETEAGAVAQINVSDGGVPKKPVDTVTVGPAGVSGDAQSDRRHHGRPLQAVCLWSADVIAELQAEGHPIAAGNTGENITIAGVDWAALAPGARIDIGEVPMLITAHAIPCAKNAQWFIDRNFNRMLHDKAPGFSRLYAIPLATGTVNTGDVVTVEPVDS